MENEIDIKALWQKKAVEMPSINEIQKSVSDVKQKLMRRIVLLTCIVIVTSILMIKIVVATESEMLTTKCGIALGIFAMLVFVLSSYTMLPNLHKKNSSNNVLAELQALKEIQKKQQFIQSTMLNFYFIILGIGIALAVWESLKNNLLHIVLGYGFIVIWIAINWFVIRPKIAKKQQAEVNNVILHLEKIEKQFIQN
jgi:uncharacterized membrane protein YcjF (UPF0283 family)